MKEHLIVCGCSFTEGHFLKSKGSWATYFGEMHDLNVINLASGGAGNEFITSAPIHYSLANPDIAKNSLYIIQLSELTRIFMMWENIANMFIGTHIATSNILNPPSWPTTDPRQIAFNSWLKEHGEGIFPIYNNMTHLVWKTCMGMLNFINFCESNKYPYRIFDGLASCLPIESHRQVWNLRYPNTDTIDVREDYPGHNKLYWMFVTRSLILHLKNNPYYYQEKTFMEFISEDEARQIENDGHPNELGANLWAEHLTKKLF